MEDREDAEEGVLWKRTMPPDVRMVNRLSIVMRRRMGGASQGEG